MKNYLFLCIALVLNTLFQYKLQAQNQFGNRYFFGRQSPQLGNGNNSTPQYYGKIGKSNDSNWLVLSAGEGPMAGIKSDGTLWVWGENSLGELGLSNYVNKFEPTQLGTDSNWQSICVGTHHMVATKTDGTLWAWGYNNIGQLGTNNSINYNSPQKISNDSDWSIAVTKYGHNLALKKDGSLWAWGYNIYGQLGLGNTTGVYSPTRVGKDSDWVNISCGYMHSAALKKDGSLWAWGYNWSGYLGVGNSTNQNTPMQVGSSLNWKLVSCGAYFTSSIQTDGSLWAWGEYQLSNSQPTILDSGNVDWVKVESGFTHSLGINKNGHLYSWGKNNFGQLGLGNTTDFTSPQLVDSVNKWEVISTGYYWSNTATIPFRCDKDYFNKQTNYNSFLGSNSKNFCFKDSSRLSSLIKFKYYYWNNGSIDTILNVSKSGFYNLIGTDSQNCKYYDTVEVIFNNDKINKPSGTYCGTDSLVLTVKKTVTSKINAKYTPSYLWNSTDSSETITIRGTGEKQSTLESNVAGFTCRDTSFIYLSNPKYKFDLDTIINKNCKSDTFELKAIKGDWTYILWSNNSFKNILPLQTSGNYWVKYTDSVNCSYIDSFAFLNKAQLSIRLKSKTELACYGDKNATIITDIIGGYGPIFIYWQYDTLFNNSWIYKSELKGSYHAKNLGKGNYQIIAIDHIGCADTQIYRVKEPLQLKSRIETLIHPKCKGENSGSVEINVTGGVKPYNIVWNDKLNQNTEVALNLNAGQYEAQIVDSFGCKDSIDIKILESNIVVPKILVEPKDLELFSGDAFYTAEFIGDINSKQWQTNLGFGWVNLSNAGQYSGVKTDTLIVKNITSNNDAQFFRCIATGECGTDTTREAKLNVKSNNTNQLIKTQFSIYPNPADQHIHVPDLNEADLIYEIYSITGRLISKGVSSGTINVSELSAGVYFLRINGQKVKFIKE